MEKEKLSDNEIELLKLELAKTLLFLRNEESKFETEAGDKFIFAHSCKKEDVDNGLFRVLELKNILDKIGKIISNFGN